MQVKNKLTRQTTALFTTKSICQILNCCSNLIQCVTIVEKNVIPLLSYTLNHSKAYIFSQESGGLFQVR